MGGLSDLSRLVEFFFAMMGEYFSALSALGVFGAAVILVPIFRHIVRLMKKIFS